VKSKLIPFAACCLLCGVSLAQHWDIKQVDSAGWGAGVQMRRHPDGRLFLCYGNSASGAVRLAWLDSSWHRCDLPVAAGLNLWGAAPQTFDVGRHGEMGVTCRDSLGRLLCAESGRDTWAVDTVPADRVDFRAWLAFDASAQPNVIYGMGAARSAVLTHAARSDTAWESDTVAWSSPGWPYVDYACEWARFDRFGKIHVMYIFSYDLGHAPIGRPLWEAILYVGRKEGESWCRERVTGGAYVYIRSVSAALDTAGRISFSYSTSSMIPPPRPRFYCDGDRIDSSVGGAALAYDSLNRLHLAYGSATGLTYRIKAHGVWRIPPQPGVDSVECMDIAPDSLGEPLIAYSNRGGVWLAHGIGVAGQSEARQAPMLHGLQPKATVVRGALVLRGDSVRDAGCKQALLDAMGRKVLDLRVGLNDIGHLPAGVYFTHERSAVGKVLIIQ